MKKSAPQWYSLTCELTPDKKIYLCQKIPYNSHFLLEEILIGSYVAGNNYFQFTYEIYDFKRNKIIENNFMAFRIKGIKIHYYEYLLPHYSIINIKLNNKCTHNINCNFTLKGQLITYLNERE